MKRCEAPVVRYGAVMPAEHGADRCKRRAVMKRGNEWLCKQHVQVWDRIEQKRGQR